jgi:hypothetical protein
MENFDKRKNKLQIDPPDVIHKFLVLDGTVSAEWAEALNTMLDDTHRLSLANGEIVKLQGAIYIVFKAVSNSSHFQRRQTCCLR